MSNFEDSLSKMEYLEKIRMKYYITDEEFNQLKELDKKIVSGVITDKYYGKNRILELQRLFINRRKGFIEDDKFNIIFIEDDKFNIIKDEILNKEIKDITREALKKEKEQYQMEINYIDPEGYRRLDIEEIKEIDVGDKVHIFWDNLDTDDEKEAYTTVTHKDSNVITFHNGLQLSFNMYKESDETIYRLKDISEVNWRSRRWFVAIKKLVIK